MNQQYKRVYWKTGQEITPATFTEADNYNCDQQNRIRQLLVKNEYGLLPEENPATGSFQVDYLLDGYRLIISRLACHAVTANGSVIGWDSGRMRPEEPIPLPSDGLQGDCYYVTIQVHPFRLEPIHPAGDEEIPLGDSVYSFHVRQRDQLTPAELPILQLRYVHNRFEIREDYIPPCIALGACSLLQQRYASAKELVSGILQDMGRKKETYSPWILSITLLHLELENLSYVDPVGHLTLVLKKIIKVFTLALPHELRGKDNSLLTAAYDPIDVNHSLTALLSYLDDIRLLLNKEEVKKVVEEILPDI